MKQVIHTFRIPLSRQEIVQFRLFKTQIVIRKLIQSSNAYQHPSHTKTHMECCKVNYSSNKQTYSNAHVLLRLFYCPALWLASPNSLHFRGKLPVSFMTQRCVK